MFDFPPSIASVDAVPEPYRALYAEKDGAYQLDEALAKKLDVSGLTSALDKERKTVRDHERQLKAWTALGGSPQEVAQRLGGAAAPAAQAAIPDAELTRIRGALERQLVDAAATAEIASQRGAATLLLPHVRSALQVVEDEGGNFAVRVVDADGTPRRDPRGGFMTVKDLIGEMRRSQDFARAFDGAGASGGGMSPKGAGGGMPGTYALTREQARDPAAYRKARAEAARLGQQLAIID
jgi:hypothetical protein